MSHLLSKRWQMTDGFQVLSLQFKQALGFFILVVHKQDAQWVCIEVAHVGVLGVVSRRPFYATNSGGETYFESADKCLDALNMVSLPLQEHPAQARTKT